MAVTYITSITKANQNRDRLMVDKIMEMLNHPFRYSLQNHATGNTEVRTKRKKREPIRAPELTTMITDQPKFNSYLKRLMLEGIVEGEPGKYQWVGQGRSVISLLALFYMKMRETRLLNKFDSNTKGGESLYQFFNIRNKTLRTFHETIKCPNSKSVEIFDFIKA